MCSLTDGGEDLCLIAARTGKRTLEVITSLLLPKLDSSYPVPTRPKATRRLDVGKLRDESYLKEYREEVTRRFKFTGIDMAQCSVEEGWRSWRDAVKGAAETIIGPRQKRYRPWISKTTKSLV